MTFMMMDIIPIAIFIIGFIIGLTTGFANKMSKIVALVGSIALSYFFSVTVTNLIIGIESVGEWVNQASYRSLIILIGTYILIFAVSFGLISLFLTPIVKFLDGGVIRKTINRLLGGIYFLFLSFLIVSIYLLIVYGLASVNQDINNWMLSSFGYSSNEYSLSRLILDFILKCLNLKVI